MENHLKERLTGAAILVALIVLLVPEMFHGRRPEPSAGTGSSAEGPPVRSYTIDLSNGPARTGPLQSTVATPPSAAPDARGESTPAATENGGSGSSASTHSNANANGSAGPPSTGSGSTTPSVSPIPGPGSRPEPGRSASVNAAAAPAGKSGATKAAHATGGVWSVQLGLFASRENAERLQRTAQSKGFAASLSDRDGKGLYHVQVGRLADRAAAQALQQRLRDQGFAAAVLPPPDASKPQQ